MTKRRKQYSSQFKFRVALEAMKGQATINEIASQNNVHPNQVRNWKKQLVEEGAAVFERETNRDRREQETQEAACLASTPLLHQDHLHGSRDSATQTLF